MNYELMHKNIIVAEISLDENTGTFLNLLNINNFGIIRDANTLQVLNFAPIFDSGTSLLFKQTTPLIDKFQDIKSRPFATKHSEQIVAPKTPVPSSPKPPAPLLRR